MAANLPLISSSFSLSSKRVVLDSCWFLKLQLMTKLMVTEKTQLKKKEKKIQTPDTTDNYKLDRYSETTQTSENRHQ